MFRGWKCVQLSC